MVIGKFKNFHGDYTFFCEKAVVTYSDLYITTITIFWSLILGL